MVQENTGRFRGLGVWKFPTGVVNEVCISGDSRYNTLSMYLPFNNYFISREKISAKLQSEKSKKRRQ